MVAFVYDWLQRPPLLSTAFCGPDAYLVYLIILGTWCLFFVYLISDAAGTNKQVGSTADTAKLDRETEELHRK